MKNLIEGRWFSFADVVLMLICALSWVLFPHWGGAILIVALLPWGLRLVSGYLPYQQTPLDVPIFIFLVTAGIGVWSAYDRSGAWAKFWLVVSAVLTYYALCGLRRRNLWSLCALMSIGAATIEIYYLFTQDWVAYKTHFDLINRIGMWWESIRLQLPRSPVEPDAIASILSIAVPFNVAWYLHAKRRSQRLRSYAAFVSGLIILLGLVITGERGVWLGGGLILAVAFLVALLPSGTRRDSKQIVIAFGITLLVALSIGTLTYWVLQSQIPSQAITTGRLNGILNVAELASEYPFIGGGLGAFPGLYSRYILVIPNLYYQHSSNLFLGIAVEQGWFGLTALLWIILVSYWRMIGSLSREDLFTDHRYIKLAVIVGLTLFVVHSLTEDALYSSQALGLLFVLPALSFVVSRPAYGVEYPPDADARTVPVHNASQPQQLGIFVGVVIFIGIGIIAWRNLNAYFYANLGAVEMAHVQLSGWSGDTYNSYPPSALDKARAYFDRSLAYAPQASALYRSGYIAYDESRFEEALQPLQAAAKLKPQHRGIRKILGYTYVWTNQIELAIPLLSMIPEAKSELETYANWWSTQNRPDLAQLALETSARLQP